MNKTEFIADSHVIGFVEWLVKELPSLDICLNIKMSRFVPDGVIAECKGLEEVLAHYSWSGDWSHNKELLGSMATSLRRAIATNDNRATLVACLDVLRWGGVRGAVAFLTNLASKNLLVDYLNSRSPLFCLTRNQSLSQLNKMVIDKFDAGMTKIYSLNDDTGSPIYDSRVGAAMAMLYQCFLHAQNKEPIELLNFPSGLARGNQIRNPGGFGDGFFNAPQFYTGSVQPSNWAQFQLKLGWIIQEVLSKTNWFEKESSIASRCRAFEACLFMIGYDLRSISRCACSDNRVPASIADDQPVQITTIDKPAESTCTGWVPSGHPFKQVLKYFLEFRRSNQPSYSLESFGNWLVQDKHFTKNTANNYKFPLIEREFDLLDRTIDDLDCIAMGGQAGLECAIKGRNLDADERAWVCMVDAWIVGKLSDYKPKERNAILIRACFAGTENACKTLITVGRGVGKHFDLLNEDGSPTQFYKNTFADLMGEFDEVLSEAMRFVAP
jgi:hypothetical protein